MEPTKKMHEAEIYALVGKFTADSEPEAGRTYQAEAKLGSEGPDSWSRWEFEATPELIAEATRILLAGR